MLKKKIYNSRVFYRNFIFDLLRCWECIVIVGNYLFIILRNIESDRSIELYKLNVYGTGLWERKPWKLIYGRRNVDTVRYYMWLVTQVLYHLWLISYYENDAFFFLAMPYNQIIFTFSEFGISHMFYIVESLMQML